MLPRIQVVAGAIFRNDGCLLIAKRPDDKHQGGKWEFPGGKVDVGETPLQALTRELKEELAIANIQAKPLLKISHDYSDKLIELDVWIIDGFTGTVIGNEGQLVQWINLDDLVNYHFPKANQPIIDQLLINKKGLSTDIYTQNIPIKRY